MTSELGLQALKRHILELLGIPSDGVIDADISFNELDPIEVRVEYLVSYSNGLPDSVTKFTAERNYIVITKLVEASEKTVEYRL